MSKKKGHQSNKRGFVVTNTESPLFDDFEKEMTCTSKNAYDSEWQAQFVIDETEKRDGTILSMYQCPYCGKWHLTSDLD